MTKLTPELEALLPKEEKYLIGENFGSENFVISGKNQMRQACAESFSKGIREVVTVELIENIIREVEDVRYEQRELGIKPLSITYVATAIRQEFLKAVLGEEV